MSQANSRLCIPDTVDKSILRRQNNNPDATDDANVCTLVFTIAIILSTYCLGYGWIVNNLKVNGTYSLKSQKGESVVNKLDEDA